MQAVKYIPCCLQKIYNGFWLAITHLNISAKTESANFMSHHLYKYFFFISSLLLCDFILPFCGHKSQWYTSFFLYFYTFVGRKMAFTQLMWRKLSYFNTLQTLCVGVCFILMVTCRFDTIAPRHPLSHNKSPWQLKQTSLDTPATPHQLTCHSYNNPISILVQTWGAEMFTETAINLDPCPIWPLTCVSAVLCVCVCVCAAGGEDRWRPSFISGCDLMFYIIWYDDTGPIRGTGLCEKDDD